MLKLTFFDFFNIYFVLFLIKTEIIYILYLYKIIQVSLKFIKQ